MVYGTTMASLVTLWYVLFICVSVLDSMPSPTYSSLVDTSHSRGRGRQRVRRRVDTLADRASWFTTSTVSRVPLVPDDSKGMLAYVASYALNYPDTFSCLRADLRTSAVSLD